MAHEIEKMAYTNQVPWHGLGVNIPDNVSEVQMLKKAGLDWTIAKQPVQYSEDAPDGKATRTFDRAFCLVRSSDGNCLDVVGKHYRPVQNAEAFAFFNEFVKAGKAKMETAGSLRGGRYVWGLANLQSSFKLDGGDEVKGYLLVASPHECGKALIIKFTTIRVVCNNTLTLALKDTGKEFRMGHRMEFDDKMRERAKEVLGIAREQMGEFEDNARKLKKLKLKEKDIVAVLANVYQPRGNLKKIMDDLDKNMSPNLKRVMDVLQHAPGADPTTGWGVLNAVTYFADHVASRTADKRMYNAWLGKTSHHKQMVLNDLLRMTA
jgi:phage/plasmid-like protein (TIGR03299 family)